MNLANVHSKRNDEFGLLEHFVFNQQKYIKNSVKNHNYRSEIPTQNNYAYNHNIV